MTKIKQRTIKDYKEFYEVDGRWQVYKNDGCIYDTAKGKDIPQDVFEWRDMLLKKTGGTTITLYYHKTSGGAEYLTDAFIEGEGGHKEGIFRGAKYIVRIDGDITKDAELTIK